MRVLFDLPPLIDTFPKSYSWSDTKSSNDPENPTTGMTIEVRAARIAREMASISQYCKDLREALKDN